MEDKNFIWWSIKKANTQFWELINMSVKLDDLASCNINDKGYISLTLAMKKEPDQYWNTHYLVENNWKPKKEDSQKQQVKQEDEISIEDIPF